MIAAFGLACAHCRRYGKNTTRVLFGSVCPPAIAVASEVKPPDMEVDLEPLRILAEGGHMVAAEWYAKLREIGRQPDLLSILSALVSAPTCGQDGLLLQIIVAIASRVDKKVRDDSFGGGDASYMAEVSKEVSESHLQETLAAYVAGGRHHIGRFFLETPMVSMTIDESNVRSLELCNSAIITGDNVGFWSPPQAVLLYGLCAFSMCSGSLGAQVSLEAPWLGAQRVQFRDIPLLSTLEP